MATEDSLFIKQAAILELIREYDSVNFQTIKRNFFGSNDRTLRYHIKRLADLGLVRKLGITKGVYYQARET